MLNVRAKEVRDSEGRVQGTSARTVTENGVNRTGTCSRERANEIFNKKLLFNNPLLALIYVYSLFSFEPTQRVTLVLGCSSSRCDTRSGCSTELGNLGIRALE